MEESQPPPRRFYGLVVAAGVLITAIAGAFSFRFGDVLDTKVVEWLTMALLGVMLLRLTLGAIGLFWRLLGGKKQTKDEPWTGGRLRIGLIWIGGSLAFLVSLGLLFLAWIGALAIGSVAGPVLTRALIVTLLTAVLFQLSGSSLAAAFGLADDLAVTRGTR